MSSINILFIGDVVGEPGLKMVETWLPGLIKKYKADFVIANGENAADGRAVLLRRVSSYSTSVFML